MSTPWSHDFSFPVPAPADRIFQAFSSDAELERWFAERAEVEPRVGGPYRFWGRHTVGSPLEAEAEGRVTRLERDRLLAFHWRICDVPSTVTVTLTPEAGQNGGATRVAIRHELEGPLERPRPKELVDDWWRLALGNLTAHLTGHGEVLRPDFGDPRPEIRLSLGVNAPRAVVFRALVEPEALRQWMGAPAPEVEARVGGRFALGWPAPEGSPAEAYPAMEILEIVEGRKLAITWPDWRGDPSVPEQTVTWLLEDEGAGTRVTLVHEGFVRAVDLSDYPFGWGHFLAELARVAEGMAG